MTGLETGFEAKAREAALDEIEHQLIGKRNNLVYQFVQDVHDQLRAYGREHDYDVESTIESLGQPEVDRSNNQVLVTVGWESVQMPRWEFGTSDHHVDGQPVLVFEFDKSEYPGLAEKFPDGTAFLPEVDVSGIEESRAIRDALNDLRRRLS